MSTSFEDVLEAREHAKKQVYSDEVHEKAGILEPGFDSYCNALEFVSENRGEVDEIVSKVEEVEEHFNTAQNTVEYVLTYRQEFSEVEGADDYIDQYLDSLGEIDGITTSLQL